MKKFTINQVASSGATYIHHNLEPKLKIQVFQNKKIDYDIWHSVFDIFTFKNNSFIFLVVESEINLDEIDDFTYIRSVLKRAWQWYKSQVYIKKYIPEKKESVMEDERFLLQESKELNYWICTDKINKIVIKFKHKMFNQNQKVTPLEDFDFEKIGVTGIARILQEIGDWLNENHPEKL